MKPPLRSYRELVVWQKSVALVAAIYRLTSTFPTDERFGLITQLRRAAVSVPANIAEGYGRSTRGEYLNQLSVANGSLNEIETLCIVSAKLNMRSRADFARVHERIAELQRMLTRQRQRLAKKKGLGSGV